jgi:polyisoprenoid-binding protein YceI
LKADANPQIAFLVATPFTIGRLKADQTPGSFNGRLTLAGMTRPVTMLIRTFAAAKETLSIEGELDINMKDFGIKPPSALFGAMKADPAITIHFKTDFTTTQHEHLYQSPQ